MEKINMYQLINELKRNPNKLEEKKDYICDNFESLIGSCDSEEIADFLTIISKIPEVHSKIKEKSFEFIDKVYFEKIPAVLKVIQEVNKDLDFSKFSDNELHNKVLSKMTFLSEKTMKEEKVIDFFRELFNEILRVENKTMADFEFLGSGNTVWRAWGIDKVVIKIGDNKTYPKVPYSSAFLCPILRTAIPKYVNEGNTEDVFEDKDPLCFIEVQPRAKMEYELGDPNTRRTILNARNLSRIFYEDGIRFWDDHSGNRGYMDYDFWPWNGIKCLNLLALGFELDPSISPYISTKRLNEHGAYFIDIDNGMRKNGFPNDTW